MSNRFYRLPTDFVEAFDRVNNPDNDPAYVRAPAIATALRSAHEDVARLGHALVYRALTAPWVGEVKVYSVSCNEEMQGILDVMAPALGITEVLLLRLAMEAHLHDLKVRCR